MKPMKRQLSCPFGFVCSIPSFNIILHIQVQEQCKLQRQSLTSHYCLSSRLVLSKYAFGTIYTYVEVYQFLFKFNGRKQIGRYPSQKTTLNILEKEASLSWKNSVIDPQPLQEMQVSPLRTWICYAFTTRFTLKKLYFFSTSGCYVSFTRTIHVWARVRARTLFLRKCGRFHTTLVQAAPSTRAPRLGGSTHSGSTRRTEFGFCKSAKGESVGSQKYLLRISQARAAGLWIHSQYLWKQLRVLFPHTV